MVLLITQRYFINCLSSRFIKNDVNILLCVFNYKIWLNYCQILFLKNNPMSKIIYLILTLVTFSFLSCSSSLKGGLLQSDYTSLKKVDTLNKADNIQLFFESEKIDFEYEKIGLIKTVAGNNTTGESMLNNLKYKAWQNGANAIINIQRTNQERTLIKHESNYLFNEPYDTTYNIAYNASSLQGVAVIINQDSTFKSKYTLEKDTSFVSFVRNEAEQEKERVKSRKETIDTYL